MDTEISDFPPLYNKQGHFYDLRSRALSWFDPKGFTCRSKKEFTNWQSSNLFLSTLITKSIVTQYVHIESTI
jgi:hypothetical protein